MDEIILRNLFKNVDVSSLDDAQKVLTFYKLAIELKRMKEPDIKDFYYYCPLNIHIHIPTLCNTGIWMFYYLRQAPSSVF